LVLEAHHCQWASQFTSGELTSALEHCNHGIRLYRADEHHALTFTYGDHDPGACARYVSGAVLWLMGYPLQSQERYDSAFSLARELDHPTTLSTSLAIFLQTCIWRRDENLLEETARELLEFAVNAVMPDIESIARGVIGWVKYQRGDNHEGLQLMREEVDRWLKLGIAWAAAPISLYAESLAEMGEVDEALKLLDHSIDRGQNDDVHWCEAQLYNIKGNLLLINSIETQSEAEEMYRRAIEISRGQNAKSVELRASTSLALLWQSTGKSDQAIELLQPVYDWFTEGLDTRDLIQANELLIELK
jgi:tetratricopeptide (TPR) repeat protein